MKKVLLYISAICLVFQASAQSRTDSVAWHNAAKDTLWIQDTEVGRMIAQTWEWDPQFHVYGFVTIVMVDIAPPRRRGKTVVVTN